MKMEDIAKIAGVSKSAVSLALSGKSGISSKTRDNILEIVKETGYIPRSMVKADQVFRVTNTLRFLVVIDSAFMSEHYQKQPFFMELIHYIEEQCRIKGYSLLFSTIDSNDLARGSQLFHDENASSGIILLGTNLTKLQIEEVMNVQKNLVVLDNYVDELNVDFVVMNNKMGAYQASSYMVTLGHRHIGYVQSSFRIHNFESRKQGFYQAKNDYGFQMEDIDMFTLVEQLDFQEQILERVNNNQALPTALFCENDYVAISVIKALTEVGIRVPADISVVGFDNISEAVIVTPELTTIHVEKEMMAIQAVEQMIRIINNKDSIRLKTIVDTKLTVRKSCKKV